ncbi:MAG: hypothetical protein ACOYS2_00010 [Patescibacteria group bacterium]
MPYEQGDPRAKAQESQEELFAKKDFNKLYRSLQSEVHPDKFNPEKLKSLGFDEAGIAFWIAESNEISIQINVLRDDGALTWKDKLEKLKDLKANLVADFLERFEKDKEAVGKRSNRPGEESEAKPKGGEEQEPRPDSGPESEPDAGGNPEEESGTKAESGAGPEGGPREDAGPKPDREPESDAGAGRQDEERGESGDRLKDLEEKVNLARSRYAKADYKATNSISRIKQVLGRFSSSQSQDFPDVQTLYQEYRNSLNGILDYKIENLKKAGLGEAELRAEISNLTKYFNQDERRALYEAHTQARSEAIAEKGGFAAGVVADVAKGYMDWRKKQKFWVNASIGLAMSAVGLGIVNRGIGAAVGGIGATHMAEAVYRKGSEKLGQRREKKKMQKVETAEDKLEALKKMLQEDIENSDKRLKNEKMANKVALAVGAGYGFLIGSGTMAELTRSGFGWVMETEAGKWAKETARSGAEWAMGTSAGQWVSEKIGSEPRMSSRIPRTENEMPAQGTLPPESPEEKAALKSRQEELLKKMAQAQSDVKNGVPLPPEAGTASGGGSVEILKGSSFEGSVSKYLQEQGLSKAEAGKMAHRMALQYAKEQGLEKGAYSLVHPGDSIQISPDGKGGYKISGFENKSGIKAGWMEQAKVKPQVSPEGLRSTPEEVNVAGAEMAETQNWLNGQGKDIEEFLKAEKELALAKSQVNLALNEKDLGGKIETLQARIDSQLAHNKEWNIDDDSAIKEQQRELAKLQSEMDKIKRFKELKFIHDGKLVSFGSKTFRYFFDQTGIGSYRDLAKYDANEFLSQNPKSGLARMLRGMNGIWKDNPIRPLPGENLRTFSSRVMATVVMLKKNGSI